MPSIAYGPNYRTPFGKNEFLGSTVGLKYESHTVACLTVPAVTIDGFAGQKILQPGTVLAKITGTGGGGAAADVGKVGPFDAGASDGRQTTGNIVGLNITFLPWQLTERDVEVGVIYDGTVVQANCIELDASHLPIAMQDATATACIGKKNLNITFRTLATDQFGVDEVGTGW